MNTTYKVSTYTIYECGKRTDAQGNPHQEDALFPHQGDSNCDTRVFVVCDGMGGHEAGEVASDVVSRTVGEFLTNALNSGKDCSNALIEEAVTNAYNALEAVCPNDGNPRKPGTTLTLLVLHAQGYSLAHLGDSRIYLFRPGKNGASTQIIHSTRDHSLVNDLVDCGVLTPEQARVSPQRNVITRCLQPYEEHRFRPTIFNGTDLQPGDCFYLCTDGMLEQITDAQLCEIFSDNVPDTMTRTNMLRMEAVENSDNHSAYVVRIDSVNGVEGKRVDEQPVVAEESFEKLADTIPERRHPAASRPRRVNAKPAAPAKPKAPTVMGNRKRKHVRATPRRRSAPEGLLEQWGLPAWTTLALTIAAIVILLMLIIYLLVQII